MKLMTWSLKRPDSTTFGQYKQLASGANWYDNNYTTVNPDAPESWSDGAKSFVRTIEKYPNKFYAIGMHEFFVCDDGTIANMGYAQVLYPNGYYGYDQTKKVLSADETYIERPIPTSLRYLMHTYPQIRWSVQTLCTSNVTGDRVAPILTTTSIQDNYIRQVKKIVQLYKSYGFPITDVEVDFEKTTSPEGSWTQFKNFLVRVKNEVCIPTGTNLRVNLLAMTGDFTPNYYAWHDYRTLASGRDINNNQAIDEFQLMTYDFSWGGSAPGPSTPLWWLKKVLDHVKEVLPPERTFIGNAGYGRRWPLSERKMGVTLDYKQLLQVQNGMYVHNDGGTAEDGNFYFRDQDFIPFAGFNDIASDYSITYLHVYDMFKSRLGITEGEIVKPDGADYITAYSSIQQPKITGLQATITAPTTVTGNTNYNVDTGLHVPTIASLDGVTYNFYSPDKGRWSFDSQLNSCVQDTGPKGTDGTLVYNFTLPGSGSYKVIAVVGFPFFSCDHFDMYVNGTYFGVGAAIPEWYPYITNPAYHYYDCGTYSLLTSNTIEVHVTNGASVGGFIICENFEPNPTGGKVTYPANLQKMKKRGTRNADGSSQIIDATFPPNMILTGELLRRPPRPAIIWEDMFGPHLRGDFTEESDLTSFVYYLKANANSYVAGSGSTPYKPSTTTYCIDGITATGYSEGKWTVTAASATDSAHATADLSSSFGQLMLNKPFYGNNHIEVDMRVGSTDVNARYGIRLMEEKGVNWKGYAFRLNFITKKVEFWDFNNTANNVYVDMSTELSAGLGNRYTLTLEKLNGKLIFKVGNRVYLEIDKTFASPIAYGVYGIQCKPKVYRLNISSLDRFEPMEKLYIYLDGQQYTYGEVARTVSYDEFGYLVYTGLPGDLTTAVDAIPTDPLIDPSTVEGRVGTIFSTEVTPEVWSLDYMNLPLIEVSSWLGKKDITIEMKNAGIWFRTFYVGDSEGYSVAYNSDKIGFIRTSKMVEDYSCKGIAMWTLGQEDPSMYTYIYDV